MEITETERKILRVKAGAILILGMQMGSELQLDTEEKREDALMQLVAMQRLVEKAGYSPDLAFEYFGYPMRRKTPCFSYGDIRRVHRIYASN